MKHIALLLLVTLLSGCVARPDRMVVDGREIKKGMAIEDARKLLWSYVPAEKDRYGNEEWLFSDRSEIVHRNFKVDRVRLGDRAKFNDDDEWIIPAGDQIHALKRLDYRTYYIEQAKKRAEQARAGSNSVAVRYYDDSRYQVRQVLSLKNPIGKKQLCLRTVVVTDDPLSVKGIRYLTRKIVAEYRKYKSELVTAIDCKFATYGASGELVGAGRSTWAPFGDPSMGFKVDRWNTFENKIAVLEQGVTNNGDLFQFVIESVIKLDYFNKLELGDSNRSPEIVSVSRFDDVEWNGKLLTNRVKRAISLKVKGQDLTSVVYVIGRRGDPHEINKLSRLIFEKASREVKRADYFTVAFYVKGEIDFLPFASTFIEKPNRPDSKLKITYYDGKSRSDMVFGKEQRR